MHTLIFLPIGSRLLYFRLNICKDIHHIFRYFILICEGYMIKTLLTLTLLLLTVLGLSQASVSKYQPLRQFCQNMVKKQYTYHDEDLDKFQIQSKNYKDSIVHTIITSTQTFFYRYHQDFIYPISRTYTWLSDRQYDSDEQIRQNLAILPEWNNLDYLTIFRIPAGTEMGIGIVGPQSAGDTVYPGGGYQALVNSKYLSTDYIVSTTARHE